MKILLHICCAPDATTAYKRLSESNEVVGYFFNPNVQPEEEYLRRRAALEKLAKIWNFDVIYPEYDPQRWFKSVKGLEDLPEGSKRCQACIAMRLRQSAIFAKENGFDAFATSLTTSPHKDVKFINEIGIKLSQKVGIGYIPSVFRKQNGFLESVNYCKELGIYRQNYCGCVFSLPKVLI
ncbi:epoxyqueuosine reductase QueH [Athalassotoga saccharophila]|uniref:epoxyqueuosine reductase QueH n=1 Tax=Athalassotoga saccharophila TaxID=1441386 RepID=UPI0018D68E24|nr:epoxyqueuosine reductase QueH [Athalassotoga saccharophila]BBJ28016.1 epoxyqueuosine reductase QueH [Athalassotoga saccharophila]